MLAVVALLAAATLAKARRDARDPEMWSLLWPVCALPFLIIASLLVFLCTGGLPLLLCVATLADASLIFIKILTMRLRGL